MTVPELVEPLHGLDWSVGTTYPGGPTVVRLHGEVDLEVAADLQSCLLSGVERADIVVDLAGVSLLDCSCLGVLIKALSQGRPRGHRVTLAAPAPAVRRMLSATGADTALPIIDDPRDAVRQPQQTAVARRDRRWLRRSESTNRRPSSAGRR
ncbi:STAS domain-containing protein [Paractinoplanes rishiriensis]|uniref:Anti-sigma factor antagonist n=1 Tax=Paractinoplanes rishiriensis TaxID=1050105 RepID=A0A919K719_9ACTN|nr:STAS domain-containing protein [Actinoplanes rishiriensis]GIF01264.1 hypothetical protein Ari01nite_87280 [Actinoplanes rishiriensis]